VFQRDCRALDKAFNEAFDERAFDDEAFEEAFEEAFDDEAFEEAFSSVLKNTVSRRFNCSFTASDLNE